MVDKKIGVPNVIIAEDDPHVAFLMMGAFKMAGYLPHNPATPEECLAKVRELGDRLDAIIINGTLAADRGVMLIVNIRNINSKVMIFVLAERYEAENKVRVLDYGADEFTVKPLNIFALIDKVQMLLVAGVPTKL